MKRARGEEYVSTSGKMVAAKNSQVDVDCKCPLKCSDKINTERQNELRKQFYDMADWSVQTAYVCAQVKVNKIAVKYTKNFNSRRKNSKYYYLSNTSGNDVRVCKVFFQKVLSLSDGRIARATSHKLEGMPHTDQRGRHTPHNKTPDCDTEHAAEFIRKFQTYTSHYSRAKNPNRLYLSPDLNLSKMYEMYENHCCEERIEKPVSQHVFRRIFNEKFNLSFHPPHQDTCKTCDELQVQIGGCTNEAEKCRLTASLEVHHRMADSARECLRQDTAASKSDSTLTTITFDLQKTLPTPVLTTGICYYKRQLWTYNLGVHNMEDDMGYMYLWNESTASRGPDEIASALMHHVKNYVTTENLTIYTDCCGGQNRNFKIAMVWNYLVQSAKYNVSCIDHKFLQTGHTFLPNDQDFGLIEKNKRFYRDVFVPHDWVRVVKTARKEKPFVVTELESTHFVNIEELLKTCVNRKVNADRNKVEWLKIKWMHFDAEHRNVMFFKYSTNPDVCFTAVDFSKRVKGRPKSIENIELPALYPNGRAIPRAKLVDLKALLKFIPSVNHKFYRCLKCDNAAHDDGGGEDVWTESSDIDADC